MKFNCCRIAFGLSLTLALIVPAVHAATNSWIDGSGKWEITSNWSSGVAPSTADNADLITNATTKTVTVDATTAANTPTMTISNLMLSAPAPFTNTLALTSAGTNIPLRVFDSFIITNGGFLTITNSALRVDGVGGNAFLVEGEMRMTSGASVLVSNANALAGMRVGSNPGGLGTLTVAGGSLTVSAVLRAGGGAGSTGTIWVTAGSVAVANKLGVATSGTGQMTVSNGAISGVDLIVGELSGSRGTLTLAGGTTTVSDVTVIGRLSAATGQVWITGGNLLVTNNTGQIAIEVGASGVGQMTVSNGVVQALQVTAGSRVGGVGTFTMAGGTMTAGMGLFAGSTNTSQGAIWITGGQLQVSNDFVDIGFQGSGQLTISNGTVTATNMIVADFPGSQGQFTMAGGTLTLSGFMNIGNGGMGTALMAGGFLAANQAPGNLMIVSNGVSIGFASAGQMLVTNGFVLVNPFVIGNLGGSVGTLTLAGGSVSVSAANPAVASVMGLGNMPGATGTCWITGGQLLITNSGSVAQLQIGSFGVGQMTISSGVLRANSIFVGSFPGSEGTLTVIGGSVITDRLRLGTNNNTRGTLRVTGGTFTVLSGATNALLLGDAPGATGSVQMTGGTIIVTNVPTRIGSLGYGQMSVSNGVVQAGQTDVGAGTNTFGSLAVASGSMSLSSNLLVGARLTATGTVMITGGQLTITNGVFAVGNDGTVGSTGGVARVAVSNGLVEATSILIGDRFGSDSSFAVSGTGHVLVHGGFRSNGIKTTTINGGTLEIVNGPPPPFEDPALHDRIVVSYLGDGRMIVSNGTVLGLEMVVGLASGQGTFEMAGGTVSLSSNLLVGMTSTATGVVTITGGSLTVTNGVFGVGNGGTAIGTGGVAHVTVSNGLVEAASILVGDTAGSDCSLTVAGTGYVKTHGGFRSNGIKTTVINGGTLEVIEGTPQPFEDPILHDRIVVSYLADGKLIVSNGTARTPGMIVGASSGNTGSLTIAGGSTSVFSNMTVGFVACTATGVVNVVGGSLFVTNTAGTAVLEVRSGTFTVSSGFVLVDKLVVTNVCARLVHAGGVLLYSQLVLDPNLSAVGDGIRNGWKQQYGLNPFDPNLGSEDADGDGLSNLQEYLTGTDPTNCASSFRVTAVAKEGNNLRVTWMTGTGKTNALQFAAGGGYNTNFVSLFIVTNTVGSITNYLDIGGATNVPSRFYRVRLVP